MTFIKNTFEILWTIWCLFIAGIFLLINLPILMLFAIIFGEGKNNIVDSYLRFWSKLTLFFWGIRLVIIRDEKIDANTPYIYLSNHRSYLDVFIAVAGIKKQKKFLGKAEVFHWLLIGYFARKFGHISVQRANVGGQILEIVLFRMNMRGRIVCCGAVSQYDGTTPIGPRNLPGLLIVKRLKMEGFIVMDYAKEHGNAIKHLSEMNTAGDIKVTEDITEGLENAPDALIGLLNGDNFGKRMVRVTADP